MEQGKKMTDDVKLRMEIVKQCVPISINDLPAVYDFVKYGDSGKIYARQRARLLQFTDAMRAFTGSEKEIYFFQELANLLQHTFSDDPHYGDLYESLTLSLRSEDYKS